MKVKIWTIEFVNWNYKGKKFEGINPIERYFVRKRINELAKENFFQKNLSETFLPFEGEKRRVYEYKLFGKDYYIFYKFKDTENQISEQFIVSKFTKKMMERAKKDGYRN